MIERTVIDVIGRPGGPYWEKLCQRSRVRLDTADRGPYSRPRTQLFPIRIHLGRQITCLLYVTYTVRRFYRNFCPLFVLT